MKAEHNQCAGCPLATEPAVCPRSVDDYCPKMKKENKQKEFPINFEAVETD
ncbi:MAG: hypothetical protein WC878_03860 [Candidatus Paceibacterota bacterium]|jgi:hypothetical protein